MKEYPKMVTLFEDGVYRWSYDLDMWKNRCFLNLSLKIIGLLLGIPTLFIAGMLIARALTLTGEGLTWERAQFFLRSDLLALAVVGGMLVGFLLLALIIYAISAAVMHGTWRLCFEMDDSCVMLVRDANKMKAVNTLGAVAAVMGLAAGKPGQAMRVGSTLAVANNTGISRFASTRRVKIVEKYDLLDLREWFGMNQIFVPKEDYQDVKQFILERIPEKARMRSEK